jgi:hypothetical protein
MPTQTAEKAEKEKKKEKGQDPLKFIGGIVFFCVSIGVFIARIPHHPYVAANEDKVRPAAQADAADSDSSTHKSRASKQTKLVPVAPNTPKPAGPTTAAISEALSHAQWAATPIAEESEVDLSEVCASESGLLCHDVPEKRLARCLSKYGDVLLGGCRKALEAKGVKFDTP